MGMVAYWATAVEAKPEAVWSALRSWPRAGEARLELVTPAAPIEMADILADARAGWLDVAYREMDGWTVLAIWQQRLLPSLVLHLSRALGGRVVSVDREESDGYDHFSVLEGGRVTQLFTRFPDDADGWSEAVAFDPLELWAWVKRAGIVKTRVYRSESDEREVALSAVLYHWSTRRAPINLAGMIEDGDELDGAPYARLFAGPAAKVALSQVKGRAGLAGFEEIAARFS